MKRHLFALGFVLLCVAGCQQGSDAERRYQQAKERLAKAKSSVETFYALGSAAKEALNAGRHKEARNYALQLENMMEKYKKDWNYGNAVHDANIVLGRLALQDGRVTEAKERLRKAAAAPASPQLKTTGPNMTLARDLLARGERQAVIDYLTRCDDLWETGREQLREWNRQVQTGQIPDFGANLLN